MGLIYGAEKSAVASVASMAQKKPAVAWMAQKNPAVASMARKNPAVASMAQKKSRRGTPAKFSKEFRGSRDRRRPSKWRGTHRKNFPRFVQIAHKLVPVDDHGAPTGTNSTDKIQFCVITLFNIGSFISSPFLLQNLIAFIFELEDMYVLLINM